MDVQLIVVPYDSGRHAWRMGAGPRRLLDRGLPQHLTDAGHRVSVVEVSADGAQQTDTQTAFELLHHVAQRVGDARRSGRFPLVLAGNCLTATGVLSGIGGQRSVFWFDAHADLNTPDTSPSGFLDGMALRVAQGGCWQQLAGRIPGFQPVTPARTCLLGVRDVDPPEASVIREQSMACLSRSSLLEELPLLLAGPAMASTTAYVHCDLDVIDPGIATANIFPVEGGLTPDDVLTSIHRIGAALPIGGASITAYAPECDPDDKVPPIAFAIAAALVEN